VDHWIILENNPQLMHHNYLIYNLEKKSIKEKNVEMIINEEDILITHVLWLDSYKQRD
jgi:hypothetical protein